MSTRSCYQCGDEDLAEVQARRKAEVRAWADSSIAEADKALNSLTGVPQFAAPIEDLVVQEIPQDQEVPTQEEAQAALEEEVPAEVEADATAAAVAEEEPKTPAKKTATKKATPDKS